VATDRKPVPSCLVASAAPLRCRRPPGAKLRDPWEASLVVYVVCPSSHPESPLAAQLAASAALAPLLPSAAPSDNASSSSAGAFSFSGPGHLSGRLDVLPACSKHAIEMLQLVGVTLVRCACGKKQRHHAPMAASDLEAH